MSGLTKLNYRHLLKGGATNLLMFFAITQKDKNLEDIHTTHYNP
jgi:hypothetical protein